MKSTAQVSSVGSLSFLLAHLSVSSIMHHLLSIIYCIQDLVEFYQKHFLLWFLQSNIHQFALLYIYWLHYGWLGGFRGGLEVNISNF